MIIYETQNLHSNCSGPYTVRVRSLLKVYYSALNPRKTLSLIVQIIVV